MDFVVAAHARPIRSHHQCRVVIAPATLVSREIGALAAHHQRRMRLACDLFQRLLKPRIPLNEWRGRLRPDHQIGMDGIRRTKYRSFRRAGLGNAGDESLALFPRQLDESGNMAVPFSGT